MKLALVVGTRPEAIKLAPVYRALATRQGVEPVAVLTRQHGAMLDEFLDLFGMDRRVALDCTRGEDGLGAYAGRMLGAFDALLDRHTFDALLVQGDTSSALMGAIAASYRRIPVGHVEAGLRSGTIEEPFPEELNRRMISKASRWHFVPTAGAAAHLAAENVRDGVELVGNTVVDAALTVSTMGATADAVRRAFPGLESRRYVLVTAHRRESFGAGMVAIARAVVDLAKLHANLEFIVILHPNPAARSAMIEEVIGIPNIRLSDPVDYTVMIGLISDAFAILSDSGGIQEEAPTFGVPVFVMRNVTERPEGVEAGCNILAGVERERIVASFDNVVGNGIDHQKRMMLGNPYGDGKAGERIAEILVSNQS